MSSEPSGSPPGAPDDPPTTVGGEEPRVVHDGAHAPPRPEDFLSVAGEDVLFQGDFVGRYSVLSRLGRGGMGVVYKAYDPQLDRSVALKVLRHDNALDPTVNEIRLIREAQTLAKLRHPNIVAVFDAGLSPQGVFVAMELVEGQTLGAWLDDQPRHVEQIIEMFREAGHGLAAAHQAGIVHRDFKPSNVLLGDDGSVRVLDFGLAQLAENSAPPAQVNTDELLLHATGGAPDTSNPSTASGVLMGTPAYMAPEQLARRRVDERSDQYTFCLCLHMALGGEPPDRGVEFDAVVARIATPPRRTALGTIPARVRRALERGLSIDAASRFESMEALLTELSEPPRRWKTVIAGSALAVGFSLGAVVFTDNTPTTNPCITSSASLREAWDDDDRQAVRDAFTRSGHDNAPQLLSRVEAKLDDYAGAMVQMYDQSCRATHVAHTQSEPVFDQQVLCLERRRSRVHATVTTLAAADSPREVVERMVLPFKLPSLADCTDVESTAALLPLPDDPELREQIAAIRVSIDQAQALSDAGDSRGALELAPGIIERARQVEYPPVLAEALGALGAFQASGGSAKDAEDTLSEAIRVAAQAKSDQVAARAWTWLLYALMEQDRVVEGLGLQLPAEAAIDRADDPVAKGWLFNNLGVLYSKQEDTQRSVDYLERALNIKRDTMGPGHFDVAISWFDLGTALSLAKRHDEAYEAYVQAREGFESTVGKDHPLTYRVLAGLCSVEQARGNTRSALGHCDAVLEQLEKSPWSAVSMSKLRFLAAKTQWNAEQQQRARWTAERAYAQVRDENPKLAERIAAWLDAHPLPGTVQPKKPSEEPPGDGPAPEPGGDAPPPPSMGEPRG